MTEGYVYVFDLGLSGKLSALHKIGSSVNWKKRLSQFRSSNPSITCKYAWRLRAFRLLETKLHERYAHRKHEGYGHDEIFDLSEDDLSDLKEYMDDAVPPIYTDDPFEHVWELRLQARQMRQMRDWEQLGKIEEQIKRVYMREGGRPECPRRKNALSAESQ